VGRPGGDIDALDEDVSGARPQLTANLVDQAGLAGPVRPDHRMPLAGLDRQVDVVGHHQAAERAAQILDPQHAHAGRHVSRRRHSICRNVPQMPPGKNSTQPMKTTPMISIQCSLYELTTFFISRNSPVPITGPIRVPAPPSITMISTSPEEIQYKAS